MLRLALAPVLCCAWWDNGHMLTAEIARQQLSQTEIDTVNGILQDWSSDFPGVTDLVSSAVWPDMLKCSHQSVICPREIMDDIHVFDEWHFDGRPYNPQNLKLPEGTDLWMNNPSASYTLSSAISSLGKSNSRFAFNFMTRFALHLVGDIHQPLHTADGYFDDPKLGHWPKGDRGGNRIFVNSSCGTTNLHAFWDSVACEYMENWSPDYKDWAVLTANASSLISKYPKTFFAGRYDPNHLDKCWEEAQMGHGESFACHDAFVAWVNDTYKVGIEGGVYKGITRLQELPAEYVKWAKDIAEQQLALGGYRLADFLRLAAAQGGGLAARPGPASPIEWTTTAKVFASASFVLLLLVAALALSLCRIRRKNQSEQELSCELNPRAVAP